MPAREYAVCLCARPPVEYPGPKNACFFMILSLNRNFLHCLAIAHCG